MDEKLLKQLYETRTQIRQENLFADGGMPTVCTDDALKEMAESVPETLEAICAVHGLGVQFRQLYAERFLKAISDYRAGTVEFKENEDQNDERTKKTLRDLGRELTNLAGTNPMLCQRKITGVNKCIDLYGKNVPEEFLYGKAPITLCDKLKDSEYYEELVEVQNIVKRAQRDIGQNELYIAYPYVVGKVSGMDFPIRCPMALFPVILDKTNSTMVLRIDKNRDVVINNSLVTAYENLINHFSDGLGIAVEINPSDNIIQKIIECYAKFGLEIHEEEHPLEPFKERLAGEYITDYEGLKVLGYMTLGRFSNESSAIQRDYSLMASMDSLPNVVKELIENVGMEDFYFDTQETDDSQAEDCKESDLFYITSLNSAQETILGDMDDGPNTMVIQGPPGTGKSQVITAIIGSAALAGKKVLVVAEKTVALEVIRSRLGPISKKALLIDDSQNKTGFYSQIEKFMEKNDAPAAEDTSKLSAEIQQRIDAFKDVQDAVYTKMPFGVAPYQLYMKGKWLDNTDPGSVQELQRLRGCLKPSMYTYTFEDLQKASSDLSNSPLLTACFAHFDNEKIAFMSVVKPNLNEFERMDMQTAAEEIRKLSEEAKGAKFLEKTKINSKLEKAKKAFSSAYLVTAPRDMEQLLEVVCKPEFPTIYADYNVIEKTFADLTPCEKDYAEAIYRVSCQDISNAGKANEEVIQFIQYYHITNFDAGATALRSTMDKYESTRAEISQRMDRKMAILRGNVEAKVAASVELLTKSPAARNIRAVIDAENRMNLNRFMSQNVDALLDCVKIWLMTPETVSELLPLRKGLFDILVIDEASQLLVERAIPSIFRAKKLIISGDHKQLRPTPLVGNVNVRYTENFYDIEDRPDLVLEQESLLDLARIRYETYFLNFHYRSRYEELIAFSNAAFYKGKLYVSPNVKPPEEAPIEYINVHGTLSSKGSSKSNLREAEKVVALIREILAKENHGSIGVITFNSAQRDLIYSVLENECEADGKFAAMVEREQHRIDNGENRSLFINSIDGVQGDERDIIIFSIGYAPDEDTGKMAQRYGWLNLAGGENRLNVAITRAKEKIYIVASLEPEGYKADNTQNKGPKLLIEYLKYCKAVSNHDQDMVRSILEKVGQLPAPATVTDKVALQTELCKYLEDNGFKTEVNVGVSGYNIDVAVVGKDGYLLGIEFDSSLCTKFGSTRERDIHRAKYLESRGWKVCRFWVSNYWSNRGKEFARILDIVKSVS